MRVAIITERDTVWSLSAWERTIPLLARDGHQIAGLWTCPPALAKYRGHRITLWYLRTFGAVDFLKLSFFAALTHLKRKIDASRGRRPASFRELAKVNHMHFEECRSPNDPVFVDWLIQQKIDILLITVGFILGERVLSSPRLGTINKHASALPAYRGLFPYFWARLQNDRQAVSYHIVSRGIDEGPLLLQDRSIPESALASMVSFYLYVFGSFPQHMRKAVSRLIHQEAEPALADVSASYHGLPDRKQVAAFRQAGGKIVAWSDIPAALKLGRIP